MRKTTWVAASVALIGGVVLGACGDDRGGGGGDCDPETEDCSSPVCLFGDCEGSGDGDGVGSESSGAGASGTSEVTTGAGAGSASGPTTGAGASSGSESSGVGASTGSGESSGESSGAGASGSTSSSSGSGGSCSDDGFICADNDDCCGGWCLGGSCASQCGGYEETCHFTPDACCPGYECYDPNDFALCQKVACGQEGASCSDDSDCCFTAYFCINGTCGG